MHITAQQRGRISPSVAAQERRSSPQETAMKTLASLAAVLTLAAVPTLLQANSANAGEVRIAWGDLDLSTAAGAETFDARIRAAARKLCRNKPMIGGFAACQAAVRDEAVTRLPGAAQVDYALSRVPLVEV